MTFLRWAGSKKQLGDVLSNCWHAAQCAGGTGRYFEAFCGSASLFFRVRPKSAVLVDINTPLIDCLQTVKTHPKAVADCLAQLPLGSTHYYQLRRERKDEESSIEGAARFIYLNRLCFNGLYRTNSKGAFNVPFGGTKNGPLPDSTTLLESSKSLQRASLVNGDFFLEVITRVKKGDFVYLDPPYARRNHRIDLQYGPDVFGIEDLRRLFELLIHIDMIGAFFVFSYANCGEVEYFSRRWRGYEVEVQRHIAANTKKRKKVKEILIANY